MVTYMTITNAAKNYTITIFSMIANLHRKKSLWSALERKQKKEREEKKWKTFWFFLRKGYTQCQSVQLVVKKFTSVGLLVFIFMFSCCVVMTKICLFVCEITKTVKLPARSGTYVEFLFVKECG